jgi:hypothetical protein
LLGRTEFPRNSTALRANCVRKTNPTIGNPKPYAQSLSLPTERTPHLSTYNDNAFRSCEKLHSAN